MFPLIYLPAFKGGIHIDHMTELGGKRYGIVVVKSENYDSSLLAYLLALITFYNTHIQIDQCVAIVLDYIC